VWKDLFYDFGSDDTHLVAGDEPFVLKEDEDFAVVCARLNYHSTAVIEDATSIAILRINSIT